MSSIISALAWIPRGAVKKTPIRQELSGEELEFLKQQAAAEAGEAAAASSSSSSRSGREAARKPITLDDPAFASLRDVELPAGMDLEEDSDAEDAESGSDDAEAAARAAQRSVKIDAKVLGSRMADMEAPEDFDDEDVEEEDVEDLTAKASDAFLLVANTEDDHSSLELHCYNTVDGSLYVHHDITLPAFPLCVAWMDYAGDVAAQNSAAQARLLSGSVSLGGHLADGGSAGAVGSFVAVGTFKPSIEIWNTDVMDPLEPTLVLRGKGDTGARAGGKPKKAGLGSRAKGRAAQAARARRQQSKQQRDSDDDDDEDEEDGDDEDGEEEGDEEGGDGDAPSASSGGSGSGSSGLGGHSDAVMSLSWNRTHRHLLASGSADMTVRVWDMDGGGKALHAFSHHKGKVQGVAWNPVEATILATCSYDRTLAIIDARAADKSRVARCALPGEPEAMLWYIHNPAVVLATCEDGSFLGWDVRAPNSPLFSQQAHGTAATALAVSTLARGLAATGSRDKSVKVWDLHASSSAAPAGRGGAPPKFAPRCIASKAMSIGQIFSVAFFPNAPFLLAAGGSKGVLAVWDIAQDGGEEAPGASSGKGGAPEGAASSGASHLLPPDASKTASYFAARLADPSTLPALAIRPRADGQPLA